MIRKIGRKTLAALAAMVAAAQHKNDFAAEALKLKNIPSGVVFDYRSLNPHGCPWPGTRGACARRSSGKTRRMR